MRETAEYKGKKYRKVKSLAPMNIVKDDPCIEEFVYYLVSFRWNSEPDLKDVLLAQRVDMWLPWLISKGYIEEVKDEREEHFILFRSWWLKESPPKAYKDIWEWFDQNPIPRK